MPNIKLRDGSGVEQVYEGVDTISVPLADGSGTYVYGLTDEQLNFSDDISHHYIFAKGSPLYKEDYFKDNYIIKRANLSNIGGSTSGNKLVLDGMFNENNYIVDLSGISISGGYFFSIANMFNECHNLEKLPSFNLKGVNANASNSIFYRCYKLQSGEAEKFYSGVSLESSPQSAWLTENYSITNLDLSVIENKSPEFIKDNYFRYSNLVSQLSNLRTLKLPGKLTGDITSSSNGLSSNIFKNPHMLSSLTFSTNTDGTPFKVKMKGQNCRLTGGNSSDYYVGYFGNEYSYDRVKLGTNPPDPTHNVFYNITSSNITVDKIKEEYNRVKGFDDWNSYYTGNITYNGKTVPAARLVSRFNHDSIVGFINTLPDTSEYLTTNGGTNIIQLDQYHGDLTDGGGVSNLTEEEIAVATAKGWTISIL